MNDHAVGLPSAFERFPDLNYDNGPENLKMRAQTLVSNTGVSLSLDEAMREAAQERLLAGEIVAYGVPAPAEAQMLLDRQSSFSAQLAAAHANTPEEAIAATNYFRGRGEELNGLREWIIGRNESLETSLPSIAIDAITVKQEMGYERGQELEISR